MIVHQNIGGISNKVEFLIPLSSNVSQIICLSEHHSRTDKVSKKNFSQYTVDTTLCRQIYSHGGECVLVPKNIQFHTVNLDQFNKEKGLDICALKLKLRSKNFPYFLNQLESIE
jgi:hypothetical protein